MLHLHLFTWPISDSLVSWKGDEENRMGLLFHILDEDAINLLSDNEET